MNQNPLMPPIQGASFQSAAAQPAATKYPTKPGISPAVQALMNAQAQQAQLGPRQPAPAARQVPGARQVRPGQQFQNAAGAQVNADPAAFANFNSQLQQQMNPQAMAKPAPYQPPATDPALPVTTPAPMPFQNIRGDQAASARAQFDPSMEQRMRAFGPRVR